MKSNRFSPSLKGSGTCIQGQGFLLMWNSDLLKKTHLDGNSKITISNSSDITINSLFYNIHTKRIEDYTKKGLDDLRNGFIRTPLDPKETFLDDPLRILRVLR